MVFNFSKVMYLDVTWLPDLERPGSEIFRTCAKKMYYLKKIHWVTEHPGQARINVNLPVTQFFSLDTNHFAICSH